MRPEVREHEVVSDAQVVEGGGELERAHDSALHSLLRREARDVDPVVQNRAVVRREVAREQVEERRFTGAVRPDDPGNLVLAQDVVDAIDSRQRSKTLGNADGADEACVSLAQAQYPSDFRDGITVSPPSEPIT